ncbi:MAG: hypothetical protein ACRDRC_11420 [Pseudonocardiaceae bacterium]
MAAPPRGERLGVVPQSVGGDAMPLDVLGIQQLRAAELPVGVVVHRHDVAAIDQ